MIVDSAVRHQVRLEQLKQGISNLVNDLTDEIIDAAALAIRDAGEAVRDMSPRELEELLRRVVSETEGLRKDQVTILYRELEGIGDYEVQFERGLIEEEMTQAQIKQRLKVPRKGAAFRAAMRDPLAATGDKLSGFVEGWSASEQQKLNRLVRRGYTSGLTNDQLIRQLRGTRKKNYKDGLKEISERDAEAVVRTTVQHVANSARESVWEANSDIVSKVLVVATLDTRTTLQCASLDGREFRLDDPRRPRFPLHVNCRTTTVPVIDGVDVRAFANRESMDGHVPAKMSYFDWLKTQSPEFQDSVIGPERGKLLRDGGLSTTRFAELQLGRTFKPLTLDDMRQLEPEAFARMEAENKKEKAA